MTMRKLLPALALLLLLAPTADAARPRVDIAPTRLVIESRERSAELTMVNAFSELGTYRVQIISNRMKPEGGYIALNDAPLNATFNPAEFVRVTPRQFSLDTRGIQRVRLSVRRPEGLPDGDYRFHVLLVRLANTAAEKENQPGQRSFTLGSNIGVSIPVVVRQGTYDGDIKIENVQILSAAEAGMDKPVARMRLKRLGTQRDIFGKVDIFWEPAGGKREHIGVTNNLNVFHELEFRDGSIELSKYPQGPGKVIVQYVEDYYEQGVIDEVVVQR